MEQFKYDKYGNYHIVNSAEFISKRPILERTYFKNGSYFTITEFNDEVKRTKSKG